MFSICGNGCIALLKNWITSTKSFKYKPFISKYKLKGINYPSRIDDWKTFEKINWQLLVIFCILSLYLKNKFDLWKTNNSINDSKQRKRRLALSRSKRTMCVTERYCVTVLTSKHDGDFLCSNCLHSFRTENKHVKINIFVEL